MNKKKDISIRVLFSEAKRVFVGGSQKEFLPGLFDYVGNSRELV